MIKSLYEKFKSWSESGSIYIYSDPHFGDFDSYRFRHLVKVPDKRDYLNIFKDGDIFETYETHVKKLVQKADEDQVKKINAICGKNDTLIILGDVGNVEYVKKLKAKRKILIMGNHDKGVSNYKYVSAKEGEPCEYHIKGHYKVYDEMEPFEEIIVCNSLEEAKKRALSDLVRTSNSRSMSQDIDEVICLNRIKGFDEVYEGPLFISDKILLSHEPVNFEYALNIHGHVHDKKYKGDEKHFNACAEAIDYKPVHLGNLIRSGILKNIETIHRNTIDKATERKKNKKSV